MSQEWSTPRLSDPIVQIVANEFGSISDQFTIIKKLLSDSKTPDIDSDRPGVYVHRLGRQVFRVGRSLNNARVRALDHVRANTGGQMARLDREIEAELILFTIPKNSPIHWIVALEVFLDTALKPLLPSKRRA